MTLILMLGWWYGSGWAWAVKVVQNRLEEISATFSVGTLLRTWFSPWKQIQSASNMRNFMQVAADNAVSRFVGASVRTFMILTAFMLMGLTVVFGLLFIILWPVLPLLSVVLVFLPFALGGK